MLSKGDGEVQPRQLPGVYHVRAQANAALHKYVDAYRDLDEYLRRYVANVDAERAQQVAALRARFETDREIERNDLLQHQLELAHERAERQRIQLRWVVIATVASGIVIALLTYLLIANLRYRKELVRLATRDSLTGLRNRGSIAAVATEALAAAYATATAAQCCPHRPRPLQGAQRPFRPCDRRPCPEGICRACHGFDTPHRYSWALGWRGIPARIAQHDARHGHGDAQPHTPEGCANRRRGMGLRVSISAGLATSGQGAFSLDEILARADVALYKAKNSGRDLVCYAEESFQSASTGVRRALRGQ